MAAKAIIFDDVNTWNDLHLILSGCEVPPATPKTTYVDIPGGDGSIDLTEANGEVRYNNRSCKFTFTVFPEDDWEKKKQQVSNLLNGKSISRIIMEKDPNYYFTGRCTVSEYLSDSNLKQIVVEAYVAPWKWKKSMTQVSFSVTKQETTFSLQNDRKTVYPEITCSAPMKIAVGSKSYALNAGTYIALDIPLKEGRTEITASLDGSETAGTITFRYRQGAL